MLKQFGSSKCPRCASDLQVDAPGRGALLHGAEDAQLVCPGCGLKRPLIYSIERPDRRRTGALSRTVGGIFDRLGATLR